MVFDNLVGQAEIKDFLSNSIINDKVAHAYVFTGPKGIGKKSFAIIYSMTLLCTDQKGGASCEHCMACRTFENNTNPDFHIIDSDEGSIGVDEIRKLQSDIILKPVYSARKVYLILGADKMTIQAQNCLLKTLEEPPSYAVLILTASNYEALIETIRSRVLRISFKKYGREDIHKVIKDQSIQSDIDFDFIVSFSSGIVGKAIKFAGSSEFLKMREEVIEIILKLNNRKMVEVFEVIKFFDINKHNIEIIFDIMLTFYRDILVYKKTMSENMLINSDKKVIILNNVNRFTQQKLGKNIEQIESTRRILQQNANFQLAMEVMLMKLQEE